jgi:hypothetical protein
MKRIMLLAAGLAISALLFTGCNSLPIVQQQFQTGCTIVNGDLAIIGQSPLLTADQQATINKTIIPANKAICQAGAQLNVADLKGLHDTLLPTAIDIVKAVPTLPNQQAILLGLQTFGPMVQALIDQIVAAGASAPVATSTPLAGVPLQ